MTVHYELSDSIATITMDGGKANVMSEPMLGALNAALDRAERDQAVVLLTGRARVFSAGYDLATFKRTPPEIVRTLRMGGELALRILGFPRPVVAACNGHAIAQGAFTLIAADARIVRTGLGWRTPADSGTPLELERYRSAHALPEGILATGQ